MKYVVIALIACVCYASERKITKKTLGMMVGLLVLAYLMGTRWGKEGVSTACPWYSASCSDCPAKCGWLFGLGCMFQDFPKDCPATGTGTGTEAGAGTGAGGTGTTGSSQLCSDPTCGSSGQCIKKGTLVCGGQTDGQCQEAGDIWCPCSKKVDELCGGKSKDECDSCAGSHQMALREAGCSASAIAAFCAEGGGGGGGGGGDCKPPTPPPYTFIQFMNATKDTIYLYFDVNPPSTLIFSPAIDNSSGSAIVTLPPCTPLTISAPSATIPSWGGGQCSISKIKVPKRIDHDGLSSFEWTIEDEKVVANLSNVDGINVISEMKIEGITCDNSHISTSNADLDACEYKATTGGGDNPIPTCSMKLLNKGPHPPKDGLMCGDDKDCLGCKVDPICAKDLPKDLFTSQCYAQELQKHYGCLQWWATDPKGKGWKAYNTGDAYSWAFDEQALGGGTYDPSKDDVYNGTALVAGSQAFKCIASNIEPAGNCTGYIMPNPRHALRTCPKKHDDPFLITFTIKKVM